MIKYGDNKLGWISPTELAIRRVPGRKFRINTDCEVYAPESMAVIGSLKSGDVVDVTDPKFESGAMSELIPVAYEYLDEYKVGRVTDWYLEKVV
jgi:hypothetical protein